LPLRENEVDASEPFTREELLYRRVSPSEVAAGEVVPSSFNSVSFQKDLDGAPSVNRSRFSGPYDVIHTDCAGGRDVSSFLVYFIEVASLPGPLQSDTGQMFAFYPHHRPLPTCGAHSVIGSCLTGQPGEYSRPPRPIRNAFRVQLAMRLLPISQVFEVASRNPSQRDYHRG